MFVYYQGNRYKKGQRYYFGTGVVGTIKSDDGEDYYADLVQCTSFEKNVPIYLPDGGYIEQIGFDTVRNKENPPWQSSIRPLSEKAYNYILNAANANQESDIDKAPSRAEIEYKLRETY